METFNILLDFILIALAIWMIMIARKNIGGLLGKSFSSITWGSLALGLAHLIETITFEYLSLDIVLVEFIHRLLILVGFLFLIRGLGKLKALR